MPIGRKHKQWNFKLDELLGSPDMARYFVNSLNPVTKEIYTQKEGSLIHNISVACSTLGLGLLSATKNIIIVYQLKTFRPVLEISDGNSHISNIPVIRLSDIEKKDVYSLTIHIVTTLYNNRYDIENLPESTDNVAKLKHYKHIIDYTLKYLPEYGELCSKFKKQYIDELVGKYLVVLGNDVVYCTMNIVTYLLVFKSIGINLITLSELFSQEQVDNELIELMEYCKKNNVGCDTFNNLIDEK